MYQLNNTQYQMLPRGCYGIAKVYPGYGLAMILYVKPYSLTTIYVPQSIPRVQFGGGMGLPVTKVKQYLWFGPSRQPNQVTFTDKGVFFHEGIRSHM